MDDWTTNNAEPENLFEEGVFLQKTEQHEPKEPMTEQQQRENGANPSFENNPVQRIPLEQISYIALLKTLVARGTVTHAELAAMQESLDNSSSVLCWQTENASEPSAETPAALPLVQTRSYRKKSVVKHRRLRRVMSRYRWSRRLGKRLFGWKWRRKSAESAFQVAE